MHNGKIIIANYVRFYRKQNSLTQVQLGAMIGKTANTISLLENSNVNPNYDICLRLSRVFGLEVQELFFEEGKAPAKKLALIDTL